MKKFSQKIKIFYLNSIEAHAERVFSLLDNKHYEIHVAESINESEVISRILFSNPDVILLDYAIDEAYLKTIIEEVKRSFSIPVILITDAIREENVFCYLDQRVSDYVVIERPQRLPFAIETQLYWNRHELRFKALGELLQSKKEELGQFAHIVSHHLREPIAKILGLASICDTPTADSAYIIKKITDEANKLDSVVKDLNVIISVRNVEKEKKETLTFEHEFSLVTQILKREIQQSDATIETDFRELNEIYTIKSYVYSVLYNLLSNSLKYRDRKRPLNIKIRTFMNGPFPCLSVKDNGVGIDLKKNREKVFGMYRRFHADVPGKGTGLHFIKSYAEALGGKIEIDSTLHEGTELKVFFNNQTVYE